MIAAALIAMAAAQPAQPAVNLPRCTSTSACPGVINDAVAWSRQTKPKIIPIGMGDPALINLSWRIYNHTEAVATGQLEITRPGCKTPIYECPVVRRPATVTMLHARKGGAGRWYYSRMHIAANLSGSGVPANMGVTTRGFWG
jgi:hypothetical protein